MKFVFVIALLGLGGGLLWAHARRSTKWKKHVAWLKDHDRREAGKGIDQSAIQQWPINRRMNEASEFNARRLRQKRA